jgi:hypothetical protein
MKRFSFLYLLTLFLFLNIQAQVRTITISTTDVLVKDALAEVQKKSGCRILYNDEVIPDNLRVSVTGKNLLLETVFETMFANTDLTYVTHPGGLFVITSKKYVNNQSDFFGSVSDDSKIAIPFANVLLFKDNQERPEYSAVTDMNGDFQILQMVRGQYRLLISYVGYETIDKPFAIDDNHKESFQLKSKYEMLSTVVVTGQEVRIRPNRLTYLVLPQDLSGARSALDLLEKIPSVYIDPVNEKIITNQGGTVKLLLNGANATEIDLKSLRPNDILRLEYYDIPPVRYAEYKNVINVITRQREDGFAVGLYTNHALATGFWNDHAYAKYNHGKHQFSLDLAQYHRDYTDRRFSSTYRYQFKGVDYLREEQSKDKLGYDEDYVNLTYSNQEIEKYAFQAKFSPNYRNSHSDGAKNINYYVKDSLTDRTGTKWQRRNEFTPVLDLYFWKQLPQKQELAFNFVGTAFNTSNKYSNHEFDDQQSLVLDDNMNQQNRKYSVIGEVNYSKTFDLGKFNTGYNIEANTMNTKVLNSFDNTDYNTSYFQNYAYAEFTVQKNKWMYMGSLGIASRIQNSYEQKHRDWIFKPRAMVGYALSASNSLKLVFERNSDEPSLGSLSNNRVYITDQIIRQGNPGLRISTDNQVSLLYNLNMPYLDMSLTPTLQYTTSPINSYFTESDNYIVQMSENGKNTLVYGVKYSFRLRSLHSDLLTIRISGEISKTEQNTSQIGYFSHVYSPFRYDVTVKYHHWVVNYVGNVVKKYLMGPYLNADENQAHFALKYVKNSWSLQAGMWWVGQPSKYSMSTIPKSIVQYADAVRIFDNKNMFTVGFSYNFSSGKKYNEKKKTLQNKDTDGGTF